MKPILRPTGIEAIGNIPWGTHFCHFYQTKEDLLSVQVPFFKTGLENNEYCIWITSRQTTTQEAIAALKDKLPGIDKYFERGRMEILSSVDWFMSGERFILDRAIQYIFDRLETLVGHGFAGLRINGDDTWRDRQKWQDFLSFEHALTPAIADKKLIMVCSWQLDKCNATDVLDLALLHECTVSKRDGRWEILETPELRATKAQLNQEKEFLEKQVAKSTKALNRITEQVKKERSERKKTMMSLRKSQSHLKTIVDTADIAFVLFDSDSRVLLFNPIASYWSRLAFGVPLQKDINFPELLNEQEKSRFRETMNAIFSGQSLNYETNYQPANDSLQWFRVSIHPVRDTGEKIIGASLSASNITQYKMAESEQSRLSWQLVQRNKDLDQFAFMLSHELRAPLANLIGLTKMLRNTDLPENERRELDSFLIHSVEKLDDVVHNLNRILQLDKYQSLKKEKVDLTQLINEVSARFKSIIQQNAIQMVTDFSGINEVFSVKSYLHSIFYNLISSRIISSSAGNRPVIEITSEMRQDKIVIYFKDLGKGNYGKRKKGEAGPYQELDMSNKSHGIGLTAVKGKIEILGGSISVRSLPGNGKEYRIEFPAE